MSLLIDTDFFCAAESWGLMDQVLALFSTARSNCYVLPALPHMLRKSKKLRRKVGAVSTNHLLAIARQYQTLPNASSPWKEKMVSVVDIDSGEAALLAFLAENSAYYLATGDKRCLQAIPKVEGLADRIRGRVVALDYVILGLCNRMGVWAVRDHIRNNPGADGGMQLCFTQPTEERVIEGLQSHCRDLNARTNGAVFWTK